jgi:UDP-N-acetylglucosamine--N-acetylmuramyl-(pentapeptide) pyrophosphoryl-undecaprenol N-acetylglucosamine transferase
MSRVILVGGGTAGHVEPALAVANFLESSDPLIDINFIGTKSGIEVELLVDTGIKFHPILKVQFPRKIDFATLIWPFKFALSFLQSLLVIRGADLVIGFGGYVSAPVYLAAKCLKISLIIHEANAKPGMANKLGAKLTKNIFIGFEGARALGGPWLSAKHVGVPIKAGIDEFQSHDLLKLRENFLKSLSLNTEKKTLLIFGGSIGSQRLNGAVAGALVKLESLGWNIIHSVGALNTLPNSSENYRPLPFIQDMTSAYAAADFVISRSGAVTCAELQACGRPALLVPLKIGNGEQGANALELVKTGQATMVPDSEFTTEWLSRNIAELLSQRDGNFKGLARHAAAEIGTRALELIRVSA